MPAVISICGQQVDISSYFSLNEEEHSHKVPKLTSEFQTNDSKSFVSAIQFLKQQRYRFQYHQDNYKMVYLEVVSPPPRMA